MKQIFKVYQSLLYLAGIVIVLLALIYVAGANFFNTQLAYTSTQNDVNKLENKLNVLNTNKALTQSQINDYNKLLTQLIPNHEDYFSILYALEQLSLKTGFQINQYTISLSEASPEKIVVTVAGDGDTDQFLKFLEDYKFSGGRLITNETISYSTGVGGQIGLTLNFYNKNVDTSTGEMAALSPKQIALMQQIQNKTAIVFTPESTPAVSYTTKDNPF